MPAYMYQASHIHSTCLACYLANVDSKLPRQGFHSPGFTKLSSRNQKNLVLFFFNQRVIF